MMASLKDSSPSNHQAESDFEKWLSATVKGFEKWPSQEQLGTVLTLLQKCSPSQRYAISKDICDILYQDILVSLPVELQEHICRYIDAKSLLTACSVNKEWNRIISSLSDIWRSKCSQIGIDISKLEKVNWKFLCVTILKQVKSLSDGSAFHHRDIRATCLSLEQVTGLDYCSGYLIATAGNQVGVWQTDDYELIGLFSTPYRISCLKVQNADMLAFGHSTGHITVWSLDARKDRCRATMCQEFLAHTGVIMSVSMSIEIDLLLSGATDFTAKLWSLSTGKLLKTLSIHTHWVIQVTLLPATYSFNEKTLFKGQHSLLTKTRDHVRLFSWPTESKNKEVYGDLRDIQNSFIEFPLNSVHNFYTPGCYVHNGKVSYVKQSMVKDDEEGNAEIVLENLTTGTRMCEVNLARKVRKLLAVGEKFALILLPHSHVDKFNLLAVEIPSGKIIGGCHLPHSSSSTPDLAQVVVGETAWLSGLEQQKPHDLVIALGMFGGHIRIVSWRDFGDKCTG